MGFLTARIAKTKERVRKHAPVFFAAELPEYVSMVTICVTAGLTALCVMTSYRVTSPVLTAVCVMVRRFCVVNLSLLTYSLTSVIWMPLVQG
ncbi:hypothetical protein ACOMHN_017751 [Nucella lapillus]